VVPVDYSAPNVAKEMHVGHLRTTVVGDALARTLEHLGHDVVRQNHVGDWGTPFGMLIEHLLDVGEDSEEAGLLRSSPNDFYQAARAKFDTDEAFAARARQRVVTLQAEDPDTMRLWHELIELSKAYFNSIYSMLDVTLGDEDLAGESSYNAELAQICDELEAAGIATMSEGALCVFLDGFTGREGKPVPLIIRKSDGGYGYGTTDLATIRHRVRDLHADRVLYVIGAPQGLHLQMVWATARKAGWLPDDVEVVHVQIGNVLGSDGKILRTRSGAPLKLMALLEEAVDRAGQVLAESRPELPAEVRAAIAHDVGIGAVKYADLSVAHDSEYTFDFDRMLSLTGNTGPYLQYAAARIRSILRKAGTTAPPDGLVITEEAERLLARSLLEFGDVVAQVGGALEPHRLCGYLFDLAQAFTTFYERCPVLKAEDPAVRASRLAFCQVTLDVLSTGLGLLGITAPEQM
jgi:arginyl-tRNA synthetase